MIKKLFTSTLLILFSFHAMAQEDTNVDIDLNRNKGYFNITKLGYIFVNSASLETFSPEDGTRLTDLPSDDANGYSLQTINGFFISPYFSVGIGVGLDGYNNPNYNTIPAFLDLRGYLSDSIGSLYVFGNYGTLIKIQNGPENGNMLNLGLGYKIPLNENRFVIVADISYSYKAISNDGESIRDSRSYTQLKGTMISVGVMF